MCVSGIYAFTNTANTIVENELRTAGVNIQLDEYTENAADEEIKYTDEIRIVYPGEQISLIPRVSNLGATCYLRCKFSYNTEGTNFTLSDESIGGMSSDWTKQDEYWYYKTPVENSKKIDIFKTLTMPAELTNENQGKVFQINILVEAIQEANINPNFDSPKPWEDVEILANNNKDYKLAKVQISDAVKVQYSNNANNYLDVPEDFMSGLSSLMPGDEFSNDITIKASKSPMKFTFKVVPQEVKDEKVKDLLTKLSLTIKKGDKVIYEGKLNQESEYMLGEFNSANAEKLTFTVKMPEELNNDYSMLNVPITWTFNAITEEEEKTEPAKPDKPVVPPSPQTGDVKIKIAIGIFIIAAISLVLIFVLDKKRNKDQNK